MHNISNIKYRRDIDGIRGIAILSVVIFHVFPNFLPGGFSGVDMFFVISGFLISTIIFKGHEKGNFSFVDFYIRRIKRIFPALVLVLFACLLFGWAALADFEYHLIGKHVFAGAGFISNLVLWRESGYFNTDAELKPLLHLWSLGIEEQFYIIWPLLIWICWRSSINILFLIIGISVVSFLVNIEMVFGHTITLPENIFGFEIPTDKLTGAFFLPASRFWEMLTGSFLAHMMLSILREKNSTPVTSRLLNARWANIRSCLGLAFILVGLFFLDKNKSFPGIWVLFPVLGTFLLISAGPNTWINDKIVGSSFLVWVGLISYPLYLWHWPLLSFARIMEGDTLSTAFKASIVCLSFFLAWLTYRFVETAIRFSKSMIIVTFLVISISSIGGFGLFTYVAKSSSRNNSTKLATITKAIDEWNYYGQMKPFKYEERNFFIAANRNTRKVLYVGDSNMQQYVPRIERLVNENPLLAKTAILATTPGCPPISGVSERSHYECVGFADSAIRYAEHSADVDTVVIGAQWFGYFSKGRYFCKVKDKIYYLTESSGADAALELLEKSLTKLKKLNKKVYLVLNIPIGQEIDPQNLFSHKWKNLEIEIVPNPGLDKSDFLRKYGWLVTRLRDIASRTGVEVIDPMDDLCRASTCQVMDSEEKPIYKDASHLRPTYVAEHITYLDKTILSEGSIN